MLNDTNNRNRRVPGAPATAWPVVCDPALEFATPQLRRLADLWRAKRGERAMPSRTDLSLRDLSFMLPNVALLEIVRDGSSTRFRVRLEGSEIDANAGSMTGKFVDDVVPQKFVEKWSGPWLRALTTRTPMRSLGRAEYRDRAYFISESLVAPLATDGETADMLLLGVYYHLSDGGTPAQTEIAARLARDLDVAT